MTDNRELYPDAQEAGVDQYIPSGWALYEQKSTNHLIFIHEETESLCHVEADGITSTLNIHAGRDQLFHRQYSTYEDALVLARDVMDLFSAAVQLEEETA